LKSNPERHRRQIPATPAFDERKRWAIANVPYYSATRPIFLARSKFWQEQRTSINMEFGQSSLQHVWSMADEAGSRRGLITGTLNWGQEAATRSANRVAKVIDTA
jgi:monoamine oxidase